MAGNSRNSNRRQKYIRFAPSPEGYYEAILAPDGFFRPADNVPLLPSHTYSPHITMSQAKNEEPQGNEATVLELYEKGLSMSAISKALSMPYPQVQKILRPKEKGKHGNVTRKVASSSLEY